MQRKRDGGGAAPVRAVHDIGATARIAAPPSRDHAATEWEYATAGRRNGALQRSPRASTASFRPPSRASIAGSVTSRTRAYLDEQARGVVGPRTSIASLIAAENERLPSASESFTARPPNASPRRRMPTFTRPASSPIVSRSVASPGRPDAAAAAAMIARLSLDASQSMSAAGQSSRLPASPAVASPTPSQVAHDEAVLQWLQSLPPWMLQSLLVPAAAPAIPPQVDRDAHWPRGSMASMDASMGSATREWFAWADGQEQPEPADAADADPEGDASGSYFALNDHERQALLEDIAAGVVPVAATARQQRGDGMRRSSLALAQRVLRHSRASVSMRASEAFHPRPSLLEMSAHGGDSVQEVQFHGTVAGATPASALSSSVGPAASHASPQMRLYSLHASGERGPASAAVPTRASDLVGHISSASPIPSPSVPSHTRVDASALQLTAAAGTAIASPAKGGSDTLAMQSPPTVKSLHQRSTSSASALTDAPVMQLFQDEAEHDSSASAGQGGAVLPRQHRPTDTLESSMRTLTPPPADGLLMPQHGDPRALDATLMSDTLQDVDSTATGSGDDDAAGQLPLDATLNDTHVLAESLDALGDTYTSIPELPPACASLRFTLHSTWGDTSYMGLTGIEVFNEDGLLLQVPASAVSVRDDAGAAIPAVDAARVASNLFDGINLTCDDAHAWITPLPPRPRCVHIVLALPPSPRRIAMIRVFNMNKSRVHSYRGVRLLSIFADDAAIFHGEIRKAPGHAATDSGALAACSETILFTLKPHVLAAIHAHDPYRALMQAEAGAYVSASRLEDADVAARPGTAFHDTSMSSDAASHRVFRRRARAERGDAPFKQAVDDSPPNSPVVAHVDASNITGVTVDEDERQADALLDAELAALMSPPRSVAVESPLATAVSPIQQQQESSTVAAAALTRSPRASPHQASLTQALLQSMRASIAPAAASFAAPHEVQVLRQGRVGQEVSLRSLPVGRSVTLRALTTHGDPHYAGLTGLSVLIAMPTSTTHGRVVPLPLHPDCLSAAPRDINCDGYSGDPRTLDKLVDGVNITTEDVHMWLIPFTPTDEAVARSSGLDTQAHVLHVDLGDQPYSIAGLIIHNYNKSPDDTFRGMRHVCIEVDGVSVMSGSNSRVHVLRRAPGHAAYDYGQHIGFCVQPAPGQIDAVQYHALVQHSSVPRAAPHDFNASDACIPAWFAAAHARAHRSVQRPVCRHLFDTSSSLPRGMTWSFLLTQSCGDLHYVGMDALALYDDRGVRLRVHPWQVHASPASVAPDDARQATNLAFPGRHDAPMGTIDADNEADLRRDDNSLYLRGRDAALMPPGRAWLTTLPPRDDASGFRPPACLVFCFDEPVCVSMIRLFNYSKTPARGVGAMEVFVDGFPVFSGHLRDFNAATHACDAAARAAASSMRPPERWQRPRPCSSIVFGSSVLAQAYEAAIGSLRDEVAGTDAIAGAGIICINEKRVVVGTVATNARATGAKGQHGAAVAGQLLEQRPLTAVARVSAPTA